MIVKLWEWVIDYAPRIATPLRQSQQSEKQKRRTELPRGASVILNVIRSTDYRGA